MVLRGKQKSHSFRGRQTCAQPGKDLKSLRVQTFAGDMAQCRMDMCHGDPVLSLTLKVSMTSHWAFLFLSQLPTSESFGSGAKETGKGSTRKSSKRAKKETSQFGHLPEIRRVNSPAPLEVDTFGLHTALVHRRFMRLHLHHIYALPSSCLSFRPRNLFFLKFQPRIQGPPPWQPATPDDQQTIGRFPGVEAQGFGHFKWTL